MEYISKAGAFCNATEDFRNINLLKVQTYLIGFLNTLRRGLPENKTFDLYEDFILLILIESYINKHRNTWEGSEN